MIADFAPGKRRGAEKRGDFGSKPPEPHAATISATSEHLLELRPPLPAVTSARRSIAYRFVGAIIHIGEEWHP